ncbi:SPASM domain-containing protein [Psychrobium sp. MM17-31]|uniref:radical SAM/SPASM domain-containing protein n=1 Tax=Psychrobium sp. MM17-31 TaxID=2917758 RepID=UPI001EF707CF|nr:radical SAM/SPASM domain-containing protein [Psychrobium sp. MM17-31]MCG7530103.1 SPASM domain-containing protein [Psychrobium sp. MM17-31]
MHPTILKNLKRVDKLVNDNISKLDNGAPAPSWIELSPIDTCNRKCTFCPKSDDSIAPDQPFFMQPALYKKIAKELRESNFKGTIMLAGYGEPMLSPKIYDMISLFSEFCNVEITTNGDFLNDKTLKKLISSGIDKIILSLYDGPEQLTQFNNLFSENEISSDKFILRDRWYSEEEDFGLKLTNRGGTISFGTPIEVDACKPCYYPHYSMMVDWNGDVFLCPQDWNRRIRTGNLAFDTIFDVWDSKQLKRYRQSLAKGNRKLPPCNKCNADGTLHGKEQELIWREYYAPKK